MNLKKQEPAKRLPIFVENTELGALAMKRGFGTVKQLAKAVGKHHKTVTEVLRGENEKPIAEKAIAQALGVSVEKLRVLRTPPQSKAA